MLAPIRRLWWLDPAWLFAAVVGGTMLAAALQSEEAYRLYGTPKYIEIKHVLLTVAAILLFTVGSRLFSPHRQVQVDSPQDSIRVVHRWFWILFWLTLIGYAVWGAQGIRNGFSLGMLKEILTDPQGTPEETIRTELFPTIPGVTTAVQFGVAVMLLGAWLFIHGERQVAWPMVLIFCLAVFRGLLWSERLAAIELVVPVFVVWLQARVLGHEFRTRVRAALHLAPAMGVLALALFFGAAEYFRSWVYYQDDFDSIADFTFWRLSGYYTTAHNNGAMAMETQSPFPLPYWTVRPLWTLPGQENSFLAYDRVTGLDPKVVHVDMLKNYGTPELNNEGGLFMPLIDYGVLGFLVFWFCFGYLAGRLYRGYSAGALTGMLLYPLFFLAILETPRLLYLSYTRSAPAIVALLIVAWAAKRPTSHVAIPASPRRWKDEPLSAT